MVENEKWINTGIQMLLEEFGEKRVNLAISAVKKFEIEVPTWGFGLFGGGRFGEYTPPGAARNIEEKLEDAAFIHKLTGATPKVATHVLWDFSEDGINGDFEIAKKISLDAQERGISFGAVNPTYFLKGSHRGSFSASEDDARNKFISQTVLAGKIANELGNKILTLWFPDGSLYPGQIELKDTYERMKNSLLESYKQIPEEVKILIEYKVFEPGTYSTTIPGWGTSFLLAKSMGKNVGVLVDLGHHHHGTNIEQIVAMLIAEGVPGGFHFNTRYAADDDHAVEPNVQMARIFYELVKGNVVVNTDTSGNWAYMIDQCYSRENRMQAVLHSIDSLQISLAKASLVDGETLRRYQDSDEIILANRVFNNALMNADVRPIIMKVRFDKGFPVDPVEEYVKSGYQEKIESARK